jgi:hypothetical protein
MKISHVATGMILSVLLGASAAHAQLNGRYAGQADGNDATGAALHQITLWTFEQGKLINFEEIISFPQSNGFTACHFVPSTAAPFAFSNSSVDSNNFIIMLGFGCPNPSTNERPEALVVIPERNTTEFSYLEYTTPFSNPAVDVDIPAHFSGHAIKR